MSTQISDLNGLLCEIGRCHRFLSDHARSVGTMANVVSSRHSCDMSTFEHSFRLEEFVDAELTNGCAISWSIEIMLDPQCISVEADIRRIHEGGQDLVEQIAESRYTDVSQCLSSLFGIVETLCKTVPFEVRESS